MAVMRASQGLFHDPYGLEHPYEQTATERFPRDPVAGQPVELGVAIRPPGTAEAVWADWAVAGVDNGGTTEGYWVRDDEEQSYWRVQLPAFRRGQRVTYRLHARQTALPASVVQTQVTERLEGYQQLDSESFSFAVAGWWSIGDVVRYHLASDHLELEYACAAPGLQSRVVITVYASDVLGVKWVAPAGINGRPQTAGRESEPGTAHVRLRPSLKMAYRVVEETQERIRMTTEHVQVTVQRRPFRLEISKSDGTPLLLEAQPPAWLIREDDRTLQIQQIFASPADEAFYGFGERFNALNQRSHRLDVRVFEQYKNQGVRTYLPVPFFLSSQGYGLYIATNRHVTYDLAALYQDRWSLTAELDSAGVLEYYIAVANDPKRIITTFTNLTGKPALPPAWVFGPWMSGNEWNSQARVMEQVHSTIQYNIPATVLVIEAWSDEATFYIWNDARYTPKSAEEPFTYNEFTFPPDGRWPDPKRMIEELHRLGIRVLLWQIPVMKKLEAPHPQHDAEEAYMIEKRYCVYEANGEPYRVRPFWFHGGLVLDFTNSQAVQWWLSKRAYLQEELEVDGFKTDGGEHIWGQGLRFADGRRGDELWNLYPNLYVGAYHRFAREKRNSDAITFSRAGFTGAQVYPCHWAGDENSTWEAFRASILAGLNAGISGIPFWGWDLAGFSGEIPSAELYLRAAAMAAFCPIMQYHSEYNEHRKPCRDRTPWNIQERTGDQDVIPIFRKYANLRMNLLPYIYSEARRSSETGLPLMRALPLELPGDGACCDFPYQYLFGEALLVAPVVTEGGVSQPVYLPGGEWYDFWTGEVYTGPNVLNYPTPKDIIPVFVRAGAILQLNLGDTYELGDQVGNVVDRYHHLCFKIYPLGESSYEWYDGVTGATYTLRCAVNTEEDMVRVDLPVISHDLSLILRTSAPSTVAANGVQLPRNTDFAAWGKTPASGWCYDEVKGFVFVKLAASGSLRTVELSASVRHEVVQLAVTHGGDHDVT